MDKQKVIKVFEKYHIPYAEKNTLGEMILSSTWTNNHPYDQLVHGGGTFGTLTDEKNFYHQCLQMYSWHAIDAGLFQRTLFGIAYDMSGHGDYEIWLPSMKQVYKTYKELLKELSEAGIIFEEKTMSFLEGAPELKEEQL